MGRLESLNHLFDPFLWELVQCSQNPVHGLQEVLFGYVHLLVANVLSRVGATVVDILALGRFWAHGAPATGTA